MEKNQYKLVFCADTIAGPCIEIKKKLYTCMKKNEDNIVECQSIRTAYEECLKKHSNR